MQVEAELDEKHRGCRLLNMRVACFIAVCGYGPRSILRPRIGDGAGAWGNSNSVISGE